MLNLPEALDQLAGDDLVTASTARRTLRQAADDVTNPQTGPARAELAAALTAALLASAPVPAGPRQTNVPDVAVPQTIPRHPASVRRLLCQLLQQIADDDQVPQLEAALADLEVRDAVRCALECIPTLAATKAMIGALRQPGREFQIGVINALSKQRWREAMSTLAAQAERHPDPQVRLAALEGLANFPEPGNDALLQAVVKTGAPAEQARMQHARLRLAGTLRTFGELAAAQGIERSVAEVPVHSLISFEG
jgi:hypothetical protein